MCSWRDSPNILWLVINKRIWSTHSRTSHSNLLSFSESFMFELVTIYCFSNHFHNYFYSWIYIILVISYRWITISLNQLSTKMELDILLNSKKIIYNWFYTNFATISLSIYKIKESFGKQSFFLFWNLILTIFITKKIHSIVVVEIERMNTSIIKLLECWYFSTYQPLAQLKNNYNNNDEEITCVLRIYYQNFEKKKKLISNILIIKERGSTHAYPKVRN